MEYIKVRGSTFASNWQITATNKISQNNLTPEKINHENSNEKQENLSTKSQEGAITQIPLTQIP
ncbi:hypothetical protein [Geoglobus ahangari]|uniref:hypothetical protein n=1 Tax=Geoglobus ahangari TaxID=113653 RepID=UPI00064F4BC2|nr:hypothetical protein [Geoglobus ahangari]